MLGRTKRMNPNSDSIQLLNTAIIKSKEKKINIAYEQRLKNICESPVITALEKAIVHLADSEKISRDHFLIKLIALKDIFNITTGFIGL